MDGIISSLAMGLGFVQLYDQVKKVDNFDSAMKNTVLLSIVTTLLWLIYQYRQHGFNMTTFYTSASLLVQLYVLNEILLKEKIRK